jgi:hypothetical protein
VAGWAVLASCLVSASGRNWTATSDTVDGREAISYSDAVQDERHIHLRLEVYLRAHAIALKESRMRRLGEDVTTAVMDGGWLRQSSPTRRPQSISGSDELVQSERAVGKLYSDQTPWCRSLV